MIKVMFSWKDHPDLPAEECERRYRAVHMPLAQEAFRDVPGFKLLKYNRVRKATVNDFNRREPRSVTPDIDAWVELYFESEELMAQAFSRPHLQALFDDHPNFMECATEANIHVYQVDETVILGADDDVVPVLYTDDAARAVTWYARLGFHKQWEHRYEPHFPAFVSLERGTMRLFLSEHKGDARPDTLVHLFVSDIDAVAREFEAEVTDAGWGREIELTDPDGNRLRVGTPHS